MRGSSSCSRWWQWQKHGAGQDTPAPPQTVSTFTVGCLKVTICKPPNYKLCQFQCNLQMRRVIVTSHLVVKKKNKNHFIILWQLDALNISNPDRENSRSEQVSHQLLSLSIEDIPKMPYRSQNKRIIRSPPKAVLKRPR